jgi:hypothetical protein
LVKVVGLVKGTNDHTPLLVDSGDRKNLSSRKRFRFEKWWLERAKFRDIVVRAWSEVCPRSNPLDKWQHKVRVFRRLAKGWATNVTADLNRQKQSIVAEFNWLDRESKNRVLDAGENARMSDLSRELNHMWALEEIKVRQRFRDRMILEGDRNTAYFHAVANQRFRGKRIECLNSPDGMVKETLEILRVTINFYKDLFQEEARGGFSLQEDFWDSVDRVTRDECRALEAPFSEQETREVVFSCYLEGAPGPDGLSFLFFQKFWDVVGSDICDIFAEFHSGRFELFRLNFAILTLIPKVEDASDMRNFRPISLLNCSFKIFSKLLTTRLECVCQRLIAKEQSAFIRGRYILESVVITHEPVHSIHKSKEPRVILKLDYEKTNDRVNIEFFARNPKVEGFW